MTTKEYINKVVAIDALEGMQYLDSDSIDLIFLDPPYKTGPESAGFTLYEHSVWFEPMADEIMRILSPSGSFILLSQNYQTKVIVPWIYKNVLSLIEKSKFSLLQDFYWVKPGMPPAALVSQYKRCRSCTKLAFWFGKDPDKTKVNTKNVLRESTSYINMIERMAKNQISEFDKIEKRNTNKSIGQISISKYETQGYKKGATPFNTIVATPMRDNVEICKIMKEIGVWHEGRTPAFIPEFFIKMLTDQNDIILDPFVGAGSTMIAAKRNNRKYIGFDIDKNYVEISKKRLKIIPNVSKMDEWV